MPFKFLEDVFGKLNWRAEGGFAHVGFRAGAVAGCWRPAGPRCAAGAAVGGGSRTACVFDLQARRPRWSLRNPKAGTPFPGLAARNEQTRENGVADPLQSTEVGSIPP